MVIGGIMDHSLLHVDGKGRMHIPLHLRKRLGIHDKVIVEIGSNAFTVKPMKKIDDPIAFLSSLRVKTKKTPVEMKREAEEGFLR